ERIGGLPLHRSIARHLISALLPTLAVSHGDVPPCSDPQRGAHWFTKLGNYCGAEIGTSARDASTPKGSSEQDRLEEQLRLAVDGAISKASFCCEISLPREVLTGCGGVKLASGASDGQSHAHAFRLAGEERFEDLF